MLGFCRQGAWGLVQGHQQAEEGVGLRGLLVGFCQALCTDRQCKPTLLCLLGVWVSPSLVLHRAFACQHTSTHLTGRPVPPAAFTSTDQQDGPRHLALCTPAEAAAAGRHRPGQRQQHHRYAHAGCLSVCLHLGVLRAFHIQTTAAGVSLSVSMACLSFDPNHSASSTPHSTPELRGMHTLVFVGCCRRGLHCVQHLLHSGGGE